MMLIKEYPEFKLYEHTPQIFIIECNDRTDLAMYFLRLQESWDNPIYKNKYFDLLEYIEWYMKNYGRDGTFSYNMDYVGFNITEYVFKLVYSFNFIKNKYDIRMYEIWSIIQDRIGNKPFCLIGYRTEDEETKNHELAHCFFHLNKQYKKDMLSLVKRLEDEYPEKYKEIVEDLESRLYHKSIIKDEIQAYISTDYENEWRVKNSLRIEFKNLFKKYNGK